MDILSIVLDWLFAFDGDIDVAPFNYTDPTDRARL